MKLEEFDNIVAELRETLIKKNHDYGDGNIRELGESGVYVRVWDKVSRLKQLIWENKEPMVGDESAEDTWKDLANYAIIALILRHGKWK